MNKAKLGRHLGIGRNYHGEWPQIVHTIPLSHMAGAEVRGYSGGANQPGQIVSVMIDPPAGGFNAADILAHFPRVDPAGTVSAVETPDYGRTFAPGHYRIFQNSRPPMNLNVGYFTRLCTVKDGAPTVPGGGSGYPVWYFLGVSASFSNPSGWFENFVYVSQPWCLQLLAYSALADTQLGYFCLNVEPVHLLDDNAGAL